jgi:hypothetical protein
MTRLRGLLLGTALALLASVLPVRASPEPPWNAPTACDGTLSSGSAQLVFAGGTNGALIHGFQIMNVSTTSHNMGISWRTTTPVIGAANTYTLLPAGSYTTPPTFSPQGPLYIIGTSGDAWTCDRW